MLMRACDSPAAARVAPERACVARERGGKPENRSHWGSGRLGPLPLPLLEEVRAAAVEAEGGAGATAAPAASWLQAQAYTASTGSVARKWRCTLTPAGLRSTRRTVSAPPPPSHSMEEEEEEVEVEVALAAGSRGSLYLFSARAMAAFLTRSAAAAGG